VYGLCRDCNILVDNRTTLRRRVIVMELGHQKLFEGRICLDRELGEALRTGEIVVDLSLDIFLREEALGFTLFSPRVETLLSESLKQQLIQLVWSELLSKKDQLLDELRRSILEHLKYRQESCGLIIPGNFTISDVVCVNTAKTHIVKNLSLVIKLRLRHGEEEVEILRSPITLDTYLGLPTKVVAIESKASESET